MCFEILEFLSTDSSQEELGTENKTGEDQPAALKGPGFCDPPTFSSTILWLRVHFPSSFMRKQEEVSQRFEVKDKAPEELKRHTCGHF